MALSRVKTWNAAETLTASDLNAEFNNICNHFGSLDNDDINSTATFTMGELIVGSGITSADGGQLHVHTASAGTIQAVADADEAVFENSAASGITILSGTSSTGMIAFGDSGDADIGKISYSHSTNGYTITANAATALQISSAGAVTTGGSVLSDTDSTDSLGSASVRWANLYVDSIGDTGQALAITAGTNAINLTAGDVTLYDDNNNADTSISMGTSAAEALVVQALNGGSNKTLEELRLTTKTASGTADHGKVTVYVDEAHIADVDDSGINLASGKTFRINGTNVVASAGDFSGPGSATDNALVRFDGTGGKTGQNSGVTIDDSNNATGFANLTLSGELDAATLDISGDADIDGTLETDALTIGGTAITASTANRVTWDAVVDGGGGQDYTTIQAGDDALDGGPYTMWVKQGTYGAGFTVSTNDALIQLEPGTVVQAGITLSGNDITLRVGAGCDIQGLVTMSGTGCSLICENGVDLDGILMSGQYGYVDGGGWGTHSAGGTTRHAISITADFSILKNIQASTTSGGGQSYDGINVTADRSNLLNVYVSQSDNVGVNFASGALWNLLDGCYTAGCDHMEVQTASGASYNTLNNLICRSGSLTAGSGPYINGQYTVGSNWSIESTGGNCWTITASNCAISNVRTVSASAAVQVNISASNNIITGLSHTGGSTTNHIGFTGDNNYVTLQDASTAGSISIIFNSGSDYNCVSGVGAHGVTDNGTGNRNANYIAF